MLGCFKGIKVELFKLERFGIQWSENIKERPSLFLGCSLEEIIPHYWEKYKSCIKSRYDIK
jgi:hypothetical protein